MKNLRRLPTPPPYISYLVTIREAKRTATADPKSPKNHKAVLADAHPQIEERYDLLSEAVDRRNLEGLHTSAAMQAIAPSLRSCYDNETKGIRDLKRAIAAAQGPRILKYCPLCGITLVATHDHHLPAALFPEFAVHPLNLVPCCFTCNSTKSDEWIDEGGNRIFIHAYSDLLPAEPFLRAKLIAPPSASGVGAIFSIARPSGFSTKAWTVIKSHFARLNLIDRYTNQSNDEIAEILADCAVYAEAGGLDVRKFLKERARERAAIHGESHWQVVLMRAIASAPELDDWVQIAKS
jgi:hypothetical protein